VFVVRDRLQVFYHRERLSQFLFSTRASTSLHDRAMQMLLLLLLLCALYPHLTISELAVTTT